MCKIVRKVYSLFHLRRTKTSLPRVQIPYQKVEGIEVSYCRGGQNTAVLSLCQSDCWSPTNISSAFLFGSDNLQMYTGFTFHVGDSHIELQVGKGNLDLSSQMVSIEADTFCTFFVSHSRMSRCATSRGRRFSQDTSAMGIKFVAGLHSFED